MKKYVVKNTDGKYYPYKDTIGFGFLTWDSIHNAKYFDSIEDAVQAANKEFYVIFFIELIYVNSSFNK